jgi:hypothetical protein
LSRPYSTAAAESECEYASECLLDLGLSVRSTWPLLELELQSVLYGRLVAAAGRRLALERSDQARPLRLDDTRYDTQGARASARTGQGLDHSAANWARGGST